MKAGLLPSLLLFALIPAGHAEIYKWVDEQGRVHYGDNKPARHQAETLDIKVNTYEQVKLFDLPANAANDHPGVVMYSAEWCGVCKRARHYFQQQRIPFREYDIDKSSQARSRWQQLGGRGVPVILVGNKKMNGFSAANFQQIYQQNQAQKK